MYHLMAYFKSHDGHDTDIKLVCNNVHWLLFFIIIVFSISKTCQSSKLTFLIRKLSCVLVSRVLRFQRNLPLLFTTAPSITGVIPVRIADLTSSIKTTYSTLYSFRRNLFSERFPSTILAKWVSCKTMFLCCRASHCTSRKSWSPCVVRFPISFPVIVSLLNLCPVVSQAIIQ